MIPKNKCRCINCGKSFHTDDSVFTAKKTEGDRTITCGIVPGKGRKGQAYRLGSDRAVPIPHDGERRRTREGITWEIEWTENSRGPALISHYSRRCCPFCFRNGSIRPVHPAMGLQDTYIVGLAGLPGVGKSSLIQAIRSVTGREKLDQALLLSGVSCIDAEAPPASDRSKAMATSAEQMVPLQGLTFERGRSRFSILFLDVGGEVYVQKPDADGPTDFQLRFFRLLKEVRIDSFCVLLDERNLRPGFRKGLQWNSPAPSTSMSLLGPLLKREFRRVAKQIIYTKSDLLAEKLGPGSRLLLDPVPILTGASPLFPPVRENTAETLDRAAHTALARSVLPDLVRCPIDIEDGTACFVISSGRQIPNSNDILHESQFYAVYPLLDLISRFS